MSSHVDQIAFGYVGQALQNPEAAGRIFQEAAQTLLGYASDPKNTRIVPSLLGWASKFHGASAISEPGRPATIIDFLDILQERAEAYHQVGSPYDDMGLIAREREIHEERSPGLARVSIAPKSCHAGTRMGDQVTLKWAPTEADIAANIRQMSTLALWQGHKEESQAVTIDTAVLDQPQSANAANGPRPYVIVSFGSEGAKVDVKMDVGQRCTVVGSYVSVLASLNPPRADFQKGQVTVGASIGFFAAPSVAPVICTEYIDDLSDVAPFNVSAVIPRPVKAMYLQPMQSFTIGGTATIDFLAEDGTIVQYAVPWINGAQNVPIPLTADIAFIRVTNTGGGPRFRLPFQLGM